MSHTYRATVATIPGSRGIARDGQQLRSYRRPVAPVRRQGTRAAVIAAELAEHYGETAFLADSL